MAGPSSAMEIARKTWEIENDIETIPASDEIFRFDGQEQQSLLAARKFVLEWRLLGMFFCLLWASNWHISIAGPWEKDPHYFKDIQISALALLKMVMHARSGGSLEIMGLLLGKVVDNTMVEWVRFYFCDQSINFFRWIFSQQIVMDAFALPVEGTETRVNAQSQAYEYMTAYMESAIEVGKFCEH